MEQAGLWQFFFRDKPALALVALSDKSREWYASAVAKEVDCTFPHIVKLVAFFKEEGLIVFSGKGRKKNNYVDRQGQAACLGS